MDSLQSHSIVRPAHYASPDSEQYQLGGCDAQLLRRRLPSRSPHCGPYPSDPSATSPTTSDTAAQ